MDDKSCAAPLLPANSAFEERPRVLAARTATATADSNERGELIWWQRLWMWRFR